MKKTMKIAHEMTKEIIERFDNLDDVKIDYATQFSLCLAYASERESSEIKGSEKQISYAKKILAEVKPLAALLKKNERALIKKMEQDGHSDVPVKINELIENVDAIFSIDSAKFYIEHFGNVLCGSSSSSKGLSFARCMEVAVKNGFGKNKRATYKAPFKYLYKMGLL